MRPSGLAARPAFAGLVALPRISRDAPLQSARLSVDCKTSSTRRTAALLSCTSQADMPPSRPSSGTSAGCTKAIDIGRLLGACSRAAKLGCQEIRKVQRAREDQGSSDALEVTFKDDDPRSALTVADARAQAAVVGAIRKTFPDLAIVAEEEEEVLSEGDIRSVELSTEPVAGLSTPPHLSNVPADDICLFVDPVDGTLEFVEQRLSAVQCLIGVSVRGRPIACAIGLPFESEEPEVVCGIVGAGVVGLGNEKPAAKRPAVLTASNHAAGSMIGKVHDIIAAPETLRKGGAGNKIIAVARGEADLALLNLGTSLWDTCATEAMICALGGKVTDLFGNLIGHTSTARIANKYGVLITASTFPENDAASRTHDQLCRQIRTSTVVDGLLESVGLVAQEPDQVQATDVARDLDGNFLTNKSLSEIIGWNVTSYAAPEQTAVRYLMSDAVRLELKLEQGSEMNVPTSLFYKRIVMADLEHVKLKARTAPEKIERDVTSYQVEAAFLSSQACEDFRKAGSRIARPYFVDLRPAPVGMSPIESKFALALEDFCPSQNWKQYGMFNGPQMNAVLLSLADLHAYFWSYKESNAYEELDRAIWHTGTYWAPERQPANQADLISSEWTKHLKNFECALADAGVTGHGSVTLGNLGEKLQSHTKSAGEKTHQIGADHNHSYRTVIHGDPKAANFFLRGEGESWEVGMIDFQWTGWGSPITDVAYAIATSADISTLSHDGAGEKVLLDIYYDHFCCALVRHGKAESRESAEKLLPRDAMNEMYNDAMLDLGRVIFAYQWARIKVSPEVLEARRHMQGANSYNKSLDHALWLIARLTAILSSRKETPSNR